MTCAVDRGPRSPAEVPLERSTLHSMPIVVGSHSRLSVAFCVLRLASASPALPPEAVERGVNWRPMVALGPCWSSWGYLSCTMAASTACTASGASATSAVPAAPTAPAAPAAPAAFAASASPTAPAALAVPAASVASSAQLICLQLPRWLVLSRGSGATAGSTCIGDEWRGAGQGCRGTGVQGCRRARGLQGAQHSEVGCGARGRAACWRHMLPRGWIIKEGVQEKRKGSKATREGLYFLYLLRRRLGSRGVGRRGAFEQKPCRLEPRCR
jgi:hypothetical protein